MSGYCLLRLDEVARECLFNKAKPRRGKRSLEGLDPEDIVNAAVTLFAVHYSERTPLATVALAQAKARREKGRQIGLTRQPLRLEGGPIALPR